MSDWTLEQGTAGVLVSPPIQRRGPESLPRAAGSPAATRKRRRANVGPGRSSARPPAAERPRLRLAETPHGVVPHQLLHALTADTVPGQDHVHGAREARLRMGVIR